MIEAVPHHGLAKWLVVQSFYTGLTYHTKISLDPVAGGALMNMSVDEAYDMFENMALNHYQWPNGKGTQKRIPGKYDVEVLDIIVAKVDALTQKFDRMNVNAMRVSNVSCKIYRCNGHGAIECQLEHFTHQDPSME